jgi:hypothetical protein
MASGIYCSGQSQTNRKNTARLVLEAQLPYLIETAPDNTSPWNKTFSARVLQIALLN